jgi:4-hydroxy-tetrahydrodipicolinate synthase
MLKGSIVALITPFDGENLSEDNYIKLINYHLRDATNGVVPGGNLLVSHLHYLIMSIKE